MYQFQKCIFQTVHSSQVCSQCKLPSKLMLCLTLANVMLEFGINKFGSGVTDSQTAILIFPQYI